MSRGLRAAWLAIASLAAGAALGFGLGGGPDGESVVGARTALVFLSVLVVLAASSYAVERRFAKAAPDEARWQAALDTLVACVVGPLLWLAVVVATTLQDCTFGPGC
jgi:hypothetical protein